MKLSVVSPVYGADSLLRDLVQEIEAQVKPLTEDYEILLVEDCSPDRSWEIIEELAGENSRVIGLSMSRNFGQQEAIHAGLEQATGDMVVTMDCDLQDRPDEIPNMLKKIEEGFDLVLGSRVNRKDGFLKKAFSRLFYWVLNGLIDVKIDPTVANYVMYSRKALNALLSMGDHYVYFPYMVNWIGFNRCVLPVRHAERKDHRKSSYSFGKRVNLAITTILSFSDKPLRITVRLGFTIVLLTLLFAAYLVIRYLLQGIESPGWMSIFLSLWGLGGVIISTIGMVGLYVGKIFNNVKNRPNYILKKRVNI